MHLTVGEFSAAFLSFTMEAISLPLTAPVFTLCFVLFFGLVLLYKKTAQAEHRISQVPLRGVAPAGRVAAFQDCGLIVTEHLAAFTRPWV